MLSRRATAVTEDPAALGRLRLRVEAGAGLDDPAALPVRAQRVVALATAVGAPLLAALDAAQAALDDVERSRRAVQVASAQARAVALGLIAAPFVLVPALGRLTGADLITFYTSALGGLILAVGLLLIVTGSGLVVVLVRRVGAPSRSRAPLGPGLVLALLAAGAGWWAFGPGVGLAAPVALLVLFRREHPIPVADVDEAADLVATALGAGVSTPEALRLTADRLPDLADRLRRTAFGLELGMPSGVLMPSRDGSVRTLGPVHTHGPVRPGGRTSGSDRRGGRATDADDPFARLVEVVQTADELGAPSAPTLRRLAIELRADDLARVLAAAERLPVLLTFPTALCLLPATVLLVGAPIVHAGLVAAGT